MRTLMNFSKGKKQSRLRGYLIPKIVCSRKLDLNYDAFKNLLTTLKFMTIIKE